MKILILKLIKLMKNKFFFLIINNSIYKLKEIISIGKK